MELKELYIQNKNATSLDLKNRNFSDAFQIFKELEKFKELIDLDLQGNNFEILPNDMSRLLRLRTLDITNNPLINVNLYSSLLVRKNKFELSNNSALN